MVLSHGREKAINQRHPGKLPGANNVLAVDLGPGYIFHNVQMYTDVCMCFIYFPVRMDVLFHNLKNINAVDKHHRCY